MFKLKANNEALSLMKAENADFRKALIEKGVIRNSTRGYVKQNGDIVGFYRTRHRRYLEDKYVDIAEKLT